MYKILLCWRYLLTRYLALACIISVMLGVATLIVVNSVMSGFSTKLRERLHGLLSDIIVESLVHEGMANPEEKMRRIRESSIGSKVEAVTPAIEILGLIQVSYGSQMLPPRPIRLIGIDPESRAKVGGFTEHLLRQRNSPNPTFDLSEDARLYHQLRYPPLVTAPPPAPTLPGEPPPPDPPPSTPWVPAGAIVGNAIASFRSKDLEGRPIDKYILEPGDEVTITTVSGQRLAPVHTRVVVTDLFKSEMSEYDSSFVFVPLEHLQRLRTMENRASVLHIKLKNYDDAPAVVKELQNLFPEGSYKVETWEDKQGPLLAAISIEKGILNVLLFLIICVAGFGILAIFSMIVVEKTRDIGILKALGASNGGVMKIFLGYGLLLGMVGAGLGTAMGLFLTSNINEIEHLLGKLTGQAIFDRAVYYFDKIPTNINPLAVFLVNLGAVGIAVMFSILPSLRAAMLHPVRALRYE